MRPAVTATASIARRSLPIADVVDVLSVGVIHEAIIIIDVYSVVSTPSAVTTPTPAPAPSRANGHSNTE
jgi:hypothetical protein